MGRRTARSNAARNRESRKRGQLLPPEHASERHDPSFQPSDSEDDGFAAPDAAFDKTHRSASTPRVLSGRSITRIEIDMDCDSESQTDSEDGLDSDGEELNDSIWLLATRARYPNMLGPLVCVTSRTDSR